MKVESFLSIIVVLQLSAFYQATAQNISNIDLKCYDCDPDDNKESCGNPGINLPLTTCANLNLTAHANSTFQCVSSYITFYGSSAVNTGIYRGCKVQGASVVDICDFLKQETENKSATLTSCSSCTTDACNKAIFNAVGDIVSDSAAMHNMAAILMIMTVVSALLHSV